MRNINELAKDIYKQNKDVGWWDDPDRCMLTTFQLVNTEIAEATEGERKDLMDEHLPNRKAGEVELADTMIRVLDIGGRFDLVYDTPISHYTIGYWGNINLLLQKAKTTAAKHFVITLISCALGIDIILDYSELSKQHAYSRLINLIIQVADEAGYDLWAAVDEKLEYNRNRLDHKRSERSKPGGRKF